MWLNVVQQTSQILVLFDIHQDHGIIPNVITNCL